MKGLVETNAGAKHGRLTKTADDCRFRVRLLHTVAATFRMTESIVTLNEVKGLVETNAVAKHGRLTKTADDCRFREILHSAVATFRMTENIVILSVSEISRGNERGC